MVAKFSTKEISVITAQTTATIYVRKSSIRKKLGIPEKEDILAFLHQKAKSEDSFGMAIVILRLFKYTLLLFNTLQPHN